MFLHNKIFAKFIWNHIFNFDKQSNSLFEVPSINGQFSEVTRLQDIHLSIAYIFGFSKKDDDESLIKKVESRGVKKAKI